MQLQRWILFLFYRTCTSALNVYLVGTARRTDTILLKHGFLAIRCIALYSAKFELVWVHVAFFSNRYGSHILDWLSFVVHVAWAWCLERQWLQHLQQGCFLEWFQPLLPVVGLCSTPDIIITVLGKLWAWSRLRVVILTSVTGRFTCTYRALAQNCSMIWGSLCFLDFFFCLHHLL